MCISSFFLFSALSVLMDTAYFGAQCKCPWASSAYYKQTDRKKKKKSSQTFLSLSLCHISNCYYHLCGGLVPKYSEIVRASLVSSVSFLSAVCYHFSSWILKLSYTNNNNVLITQTMSFCSFSQKFLWATWVAQWV